MPDAAPEITAVLPSCLFVIDHAPVFAARLFAYKEHVGEGLGKAETLSHRREQECGS
jgi:hypothetical protein